MKATLLFVCIIITSTLTAQNKNLISGPWAGNVQLKTAYVWLEVSPQVKKVTVNYFPEGRPALKLSRSVIPSPVNDFYPVKVELNNLEIHTTYQYQILLDGILVNTPFITKFTTQELWQYRKPAPDFTFLAGSCSYVNEPAIDRPGNSYGGDSSIFSTMAKETAAFHIWMGDNWYTREVDYTSAWGLTYRASRDRSLKILQPFMATMPQYSIWDDHDYGPNDAGKSFLLKNESRNIFKNYSLNPTYGEDGKGIYTQFTYSDAEFFLTDDRYFRSNDGMTDTVDGNGNRTKDFFGPMQLEWLKNALLFSSANFKVVIVGSQVCNPLNVYESMRSYKKEYEELMTFLETKKIKGVIFFSGDRHHSEVIKIERPGLYPLYDVTASSYTAGISTARGKEKDNAFRVPGTLVEVNNYSRISVTGIGNDRKMVISFIDIRGNIKGSCEIKASELK